MSVECGEGGCKPVKDLSKAIETNTSRLNGKADSRFMNRVIGAMIAFALIYAAWATVQICNAGGEKEVNENSKNIASLIEITRNQSENTDKLIKAMEDDRDVMAEDRKALQEHIKRDYKDHYGKEAPDD